MSDGLTISGDIASLVGLAVSLYILWTVRELRVRYLFRARLPELIKRLRQHANELSSQLARFEDSSREIETVIATAIASLNNLRPKVRGDEKKAVRELLELCRRRKRPTEKEAAWRIYGDLQALIEGLQHHAKDAKWSR